MAMRDLPVLVVGAGVSGLTTAITLAEAGVAVEICSAAPPLQTTSAAAGASWAPYQVNHELVEVWSQMTLDVLTGMSDRENVGVRLVWGIDAARAHLEPPDWTRRLPSYRECRLEELPPGYEVGWWYRIPIVDMPVYLTHLSTRLRRLGVPIEPRRVTSFSLEAAERAVINCTGFAAGELCHDRLLTPAKGQLVVVRNPGITTFFQDCDELEEELVYILPHGDHVILGGCAEKGVADLVASKKMAREIVRRCAKIDRRLLNAEVLEHRVGVRPSRTEVRLEREGSVIHNYGHGGAGVTLSWGCAATVLELVKELGVAHGV